MKTRPVVKGVFPKGKTTIPAGKYIVGYPAAQKILLLNSATTQYQKTWGQQEGI